MRTLGAVLLLAAAGNDELAAARDAMRALHYPEALKALSSAEQAGNLEPAQLAQLYELQGVCLATLKRREAVEAFRKLLALAPDHHFDSPRAPRVMTPYYEARDWAKQNGALTLKLDEVREGKKLTLTLALADPLAMAKGLEVKLVEDGVARELSFQKLPARVESVAASVEATVTVVDARHNRLALKSARFAAPAAAAEAPAPAVVPVPVLVPAPVAAAPLPVEEVVEPRRGVGGKRVAGILALVAAVPLVASGAGAGLLSQSSRAQFQLALNGSMTLSMQEAQQLNSQVVSYAWAANVLFACAGALLIAGLALIIFGAPE